MIGYTANMKGDMIFQNYVMVTMETIFLEYYCVFDTTKLVLVTSG